MAEEHMLSGFKKWLAEDDFWLRKIVLGIIQRGFPT
jgi:hypothetical protein